MSTKIQLIKESEIFINPTDLMKYIYEMSEKFYTEKTVYLSPVEKNEAKSITPKISGPVIEKLVQELGESNTGYMIIRRDTEISVIIPPFPFSMDAIIEGDDTIMLEDMFDSSFEVGVVLIRLGRFAIGVLKGDQLISSKTDTRQMKNRHRAGGSSQRRFERSRERLIRELFDKTCEVSKSLFDPHKSTIKYVFLGGEKHTIGRFLNRCEYLQKSGFDIQSRVLSVDVPNNDAIKSIHQEVYKSKLLNYKIVIN